MRNSCIGLIVAASIVAAGCSRKSEVKPVSFFPESNEVAGWTRAADTRTFEADNLWQYIDGDADRYVQAGVVRTLTADYRYQNTTDAVADVYVMKSAEGATKIFEGEPARDSQPVTIGEAARLYGGSLTFHKGPYFVRLVAYKSGAEIGNALRELARGIEKRLAP
jgi:hypothetical protein